MHIVVRDSTFGQESIAPQIGVMSSPQQWKAQATVVVRDARGKGVEGVQFRAKWSECQAHPVQGIATWYDFQTHPIQGVTDTDGRCVLKSPIMETNIKQVHFSIASNTKSDDEYIYDIEAHLDPDSRPVYTITITQTQSI